jgi:hypothetical protein
LGFSDSFSVLLSDVETTGSSSEFYDKFTIRYHISLILKGMWDSPVHRQAIVNESRLLTNMNILGILSISVVEPSVPVAGTEPSMCQLNEWGMSVDACQVGIDSKQNIQVNLTLI